MIRNLDTKLYWRSVIDKTLLFRCKLQASEQIDGGDEGIFYLEYVKERFYAFRSALSDQYVSAEVEKFVCEKDIPLAWEYFEFEIVK